MRRVTVYVLELRATLEKTIALAAAALVSLILVNKPHVGIDGKVLFAAALGVGMWLPLFARRRQTFNGALEHAGIGGLVLRVDDQQVVVPFRAITGFSAVAGRCTHSVLMTTDDGRVLTLVFEDRTEVEKLRELFGKNLEAARIPTAPATPLQHLLRFGGSLATLGYYLHTQHQWFAIPNAKAWFGLSALSAGAGLLVSHLFARTSRLSGDLGPVRDRELAEYPRGARAAVRAHLQQRPASRREEPSEASAASQAADSRSVLGPVGERREALEALARVRLHIDGEANGYRGAREALASQLEVAARAAETPLSTRALCLRVLARRDEATLAAHMTSLSLDREEADVLSEVAMAETDEDAVTVLQKRTLGFR
jgi:hypothetical protein